jgi:hypothetical protein
MDDDRPSGEPQAQHDPAFEFERYQRQWAVLCHLSALLQIAMLPTIGNILGPAIVWLVKKDQYPLVNVEGKESLNFQISMSLYAWLVSALLALTCIGKLLIPLAVLALSVVDVVLVVMASVRTNRQEVYRYPLSIRFLS